MSTQPMSINVNPNEHLLNDGFVGELIVPKREIVSEDSASEDSNVDFKNYGEICSVQVKIESETGGADFDDNENDIFRNWDLQAKKVKLESVDPGPIGDGGHPSESSNKPADHPIRVINAKLFKCQHCNRTFARAVILKQHLQTHTQLQHQNSPQHLKGEHLCNQCGMCCQREDDLLWHMQTHVAMSDEALAGTDISVGSPSSSTSEEPDSDNKPSTPPRALIIGGGREVTLGSQPIKIEPEIEPEIDTDDGDDVFRNWDLQIKKVKLEPANPGPDDDGGHPLEMVEVELNTDRNSAPGSEEDSWNIQAKRIEKRLLEPHPRPFECTQCNRTFTRMSDFTEHMRCPHLLKETEATLSQDKDVHTCEQCGIFYVRRGNLLRHMRSHASALPINSEDKDVHICEQCGRSYARRCTLLRHMRSHATTSEISEGSASSGIEESDS